MPKVYIPNKASHDYDNARDYGDLVYLSEGHTNRFATNNIYRKFHKILKSSKQSDYLLLTGLTVMNVIAAGIMIKQNRKINILIFRPKDHGYTERRLDFTDL